MTTWLLIAVMAMTVATVGVHLGLPKAIAEVVVRVCECHKCLSFWLALCALIVLDCPLRYTILLSLMAAYLSHWLGLLLILLKQLYDLLWQKANRKRKK